MQAQAPKSFFRDGDRAVGWMIKLVQQTGMVLGIMACVTGGTLGAVKLAEMVKRLPDRKKDIKKT